jgi:hypothetical protein
MNRVSQFSFSAGRINRNLIGRRDMSKYYNGAFEINNFIVKRHGVLEKRHGFKLASVIDDTFRAPSRIIPFFWNNKKCNYLVMSDWYIDVLDIDGKPVSRMYYPVSNSTHGWTSDDVGALDYCQIGDIIFFASRVRQPFRVRRRGENDFVTEAIVFEDITRNAEHAPKLTAVKNVKEGSGSTKRTIKYRASEVVGGKEVFIGDTLELPDTWFPWAEGGNIVLTVEKRSTNDVDGYRFYRNEGSGWGYIGSTEDSYTGIETLSPKFYPSTFADGKWKTQYRVVGVENKSFRMERISFSAYSTANILSVVIENEDENTRKCTITLARPKYNTFKLDFVDGEGTSYLDENTRVITRIELDSIASDYGFSEKDDGSGWVLIVRYPNDGNADEKIDKDIEMITNSISSACQTTVRTQSRAFNYSDNVFIEITPTGVAYENGEEPQASLDIEVDIVSFINDLLTFTDDYIQGDYSKTVPNYRNPFDSQDNYPGVVGIYQQRMVWASTNNDPSMFWMSVPGDIYNYSVHSNIQADDMINAALPLSRGPRILHMISHRYLVMLCENSECVVKSGGDSGLSYDNISCEQQSYTGSNERVRPLLCGNAIIFSDRAGASAREYKYDYAMDAMAGTDLSVLSSELFERSGGIVDWTYQMFPDSVVWAVLADGTLALFTYMPEQEVYAWSSATLPEGYKAIGIACADALQDAKDHNNQIYKMSSIAVLAKKDDNSNARYIFTLDGTSFSDIVENSEMKPIVGTVECVIPDAQGSTEGRRKRVVKAILRGDNLDNVTFGLRDRKGHIESMSPSRQESSFVDAQLTGDYCYDPQLVIRDEGTNGTVLMGLLTDMDCMDVGF